MPKCPKCGHDKFITSDFDLDHEKYDLVAICCQKCDCIIGITEPYNIGETTMNLNSALWDLVKLLKSRDKAAIDPLP